MTRITKYVDALVTKTDTHGDLTAGREPRCCSIPLVHLKSMFEIQIWKLIGAECTRWGGDGPVWLLWAGRDLRLGLFRRREAAACPSPYTQLFILFYTVAVSCSNMFIYVLEEDLRRFQRGDHEIACPLLILFFYTAFILFILLHFFSQICTIVQSWAGRAPSGPL